MSKKQISCISLLFVHCILLLCPIINLFRCFFVQKLLVLPFGYSFLNIPFYRYVHNDSVIDFGFLIVFVALSVFLTIKEFKEIINQKKLTFIFLNCFWIWSCSWYSNFINMIELKTFYSIYSQIFTGISMLIGLASLTAITVIQTSSMVKHRTALDLEKSKYISPNKLIITFIGLFIFVIITNYFIGFNEILKNVNVFTKYLVYIFGIYLGIGSILQSVNRIRKLKKINYINSEEQMATLKSDRKKKIIALAVFVLSYFIFYLF